jgi:predicted aspartyl protease/tetratricopeptide (TPR) repeat protein
MRRSNSKKLIGRLAVGTLAAITICLSSFIATGATFAQDQKALSRAERALHDGEYELAEKLYRELLSKDERDKEARLGLSFALLKQRNLQDAYDHAARVLLVDPLSARAHALLGSAILAGGDFRDSVEEFRTALSINEGESLAIAGLAMIDFYENRMDLAIRSLRRAAALNPNEPDYIFSLGQAAARSERYQEAAAAYERFLSVAPKTDADRRARIRGLIDFLRYLGKQSSLYMVGGANRTVIPIASADTRPILLVRVNGEKTPLRFVLDTGSGMSVISEQTAKRLGLHPVARGGMARAVGGGGRFEIVYGFLSSIEMGDVRVENVPVYVRHFFDDKVSVDGYIGLSVISKFVASVDYGEGTFTLTRHREVATDNQFDMVYRPEPRATVASVVPAGAVEIPVRTTSSGFLSGEVRLEGFPKPLNFIIDTGASVTVVSEKLAASEEMTAYIDAGRMRVFGAAGITDDVKTLILPRVVLGTFSREKVNAAILDLEPVNETAGFKQSGILGGNFLKHFRVSFDFQRGVIRLELLNQTARGADGGKPLR